MKARLQPISELNRRARNALIRELGVLDALRFLNQCGVGTGDYTSEREHLFKDVSVESIIADIKTQRRDRTKPLP